MAETGATMTPASNMQYCSKCRKTMALVNFYTYRDGTKCELCKNCLTMHVNNFEPDTFLWILEKFDVPYIPSEWNNLRDKAYAKDPHKVTGMSVLGKYFSKMKLNQWKDLRWSDTEMMIAREEQQDALHNNAADQREAKIQEMREAFERGEITEAQFKTYEETHAPVPTFVEDTGTDQGGVYPANSKFEQVDIGDVGADLTQEDKVYLAIKWGRFYTAEQWVALEKLYNEFMNTFDIQGAARIDTLKKICKTSLKMDEAIDCGDVDSYQKLSRVYDALMKSGKFTEAQRKEEKSGEFDSVGQIVYFAEKEGGAIHRYKIDTPLDIVDKSIDNLKKYTKDLIINDPTLSQMLENLIKRREIAANQKADMQAASAQGLDYVPLEDQDHIDLINMIEEQKKIDNMEEGDE